MSIYSRRYGRCFEYKSKLLQCIMGVWKKTYFFYKFIYIIYILTWYI